MSDQDKPPKYQFFFAAEFLVLNLQKESEWRELGIIDVSDIITVSIKADKTDREAYEASPRY
jgi:hypothetical protein